MKTCKTEAQQVLGRGARVRTHLGDTGTILGKLWTGQYEVEIDNSEDKQLVKRWLGNMRETYSPHELTSLCPSVKDEPRA